MKREGQSIKHWILAVNFIGLLLCLIFLSNYYERDTPSWTISGIQMRPHSQAQDDKLNLTRYTKGNRKFSLQLSQEKTGQLTHTKLTRLLLASALIQNSRNNWKRPKSLSNFELLPLLSNQIQNTSYNTIPSFRGSSDVINSGMSLVSSPIAEGNNVTGSSPTTCSSSLTQMLVQKHRIFKFH